MSLQCEFYFNRFSRDVDNVDKMVSHYIYDTFLFLSPLLASLATVIYVIPLMTVVIVPLSIVFLTLQVSGKPTSLNESQKDDLCACVLFFKLKNLGVGCAVCFCLLLLHIHV